LDRDNDPAILLQPLADRRQALPFGFDSSDLKPQGAQVAGLGGRLFPRRCARRSLVSVIHCCSGFCVFLGFRQGTNSLLSSSTFFDTFQQQQRQQTWVVEHKGLSDALVEYAQ
jgi:hypothetical protein